MALRVLTWNLRHGRAEPPAGRDLLAEFGDALASWEWDAALLQEVPPWWPEPLGGVTGAVWDSVLTSRNALLPLRRAIATRWPDIARSGGGGANTILVRHPRRIDERRHLRLRLLPERRRLHAVRLVDGTWFGNLHATVWNDEAAQAEGSLAARSMLEWADGAPVVLGGDFNTREPALEGFTHAGGDGVDHVFVKGLAADPSGGQILERGTLSDHAPVLVHV